MFIGTAIKTSYERDQPRSSLNLTTCDKDDFSECSNVSIRMCTMIAGVICTEREIPCDSDDQSRPPCQVSVIKITHYPTPSLTMPTPSLTTPTPTITCSTTGRSSGQLGACTANVTSLGVLAGVLIALLIAIVIGWVCTWVAMKRRTGIAKTRSVYKMLRLKVHCHGFRKNTVLQIHLISFSSVCVLTRILFLITLS